MSIVVEAALHLLGEPGRLVGPWYFALRPVLERCHGRCLHRLRAFPLSADTWITLAIVAIAAANVLLWLFTTPFHGGPDEGAHFQVARFIRDHGRLPTFHPNDLWLIETPQGVVETYATFPPLTYMLAALAIAPFPDNPYWAARAISIAAYLGTVGLTFCVGRQLIPSARTIAVGAALTVAFLPQFAFTGAYLNTDSLAAFESALLSALLVHAWRSGLHPGLAFWLGAAVGAMLLTRYTAYAFAAVGLLAGLVLAWRASRVWRNGTALLVGVALSSGWWFLQNWHLYGEVIPARVVAEAKAAAGGNTLFVPAKHGINLLTLSTQTDFWEITLQSFVGVFGMLDVFLQPTYYALCAGGGALAMVGLVRWLLRPGRRRDRWVVGTVAGGVIAGTVLSAMVISTYGEFSPQGRYLFPALVPTAIALATGWYVLRESRAELRCVPTIAALGMVALDAVSLLGHVVPQEFGPQSRQIVVQIDRPPPAVPSDRPVEVLGWSYIEGAVRWQPYAPEVVAGYRRPVRDVLVYLDGPPGVGVAYGPARYGLPRKDVREFYGGNPRLEPVGYRLLLPPHALAPGGHDLYVCAAAPPVREATCSSRHFEVL